MAVAAGFQPAVNSDRPEAHSHNCIVDFERHPILLEDARDNQHPATGPLNAVAGPRTVVTALDLNLVPPSIHAER